LLLDLKGLLLDQIEQRGQKGSQDRILFQSDDMIFES
jgi:hypothetical protein